MQQLERSLQKSSVEFQNLQAELEKAVDTRQTLAGQLNENESVLKEFDALPNKGVGAKVYKAMGPVLLQQDPAEAKSNVQKRIDFIQGDIRRAETLLKELSEKGEKKKEEVRASWRRRAIRHLAEAVLRPDLASSSDYNLNCKGRRQAVQAKARM
ncbi:Prefoldin [Ceraceosorus guamensis]|uniref:Prefoldin n=1 Tax=Ceraceosorus guamensis TaxID=1522189 RepID=A0A316WFR5_9BASI|nr:Prefoldin [Ceraceosorus guamensis]PWN46085.1 Prefoldin [Ceraceosorus guamensis]